MIIDPSGRGPTMRQLVVAGIVLLLIAILTITLLMLRYQGVFKDKVKVAANLTTTGDGLPANADVKYRGVLVGTVHDVSVAAKGESQRVDIELKPEYVDSIPSTVTARVVPSNIFAVTSVEFIDNGPAAPLHEGDEVEEDKSKETIALQTTLTSLRDILGKVEPVKLGQVLGTMADALNGNGRDIGLSIERLDRWVTQVDQSIPDLRQDLQNWNDAVAGINQSMPQLITVLDSSLTTARTIAEKRSQLVSLLSSGSGTVDTVDNLFAHNPDQGKALVAGLNNTFGSLTSEPSAIPGTFAALSDSLNKLTTVFHYGPSNQMVWNVTVGFTPFDPYTVADCPRYGSMAGPSCATAPSVADPGTLPPSLAPGRLASAGPAPILPTLPLPTLPTLPGLPAIPGLTGPKPASAPTPADPGLVRPASYRGPAAVSAYTGRQPTAMEMLLLGNAFQGTTLTATPVGGDGQ
ncbi:MlaD family protein [Antrihabitans cavernicola]|uniref:MCE family protein n=1 Tax=Antrihabitans cavernicola TaxID=2495913 RepID=A0A5A7S3H1_9NOCA|nr:MCE family protein [Spelaeibacter cavernicola]KAA0019435.1 MCE family protein [Spelaeibacter cavernicola]